MKYLFLIDLQNDFIDFTFGTLEAQAIIPKVVEKIKNFDGIVVYTQDTHIFENFKYQESIEEKRLFSHCLKYEKGWKLNKEIFNALIERSNCKNTICVEKNTFGIDFDTWNEIFEKEIEKGHFIEEDEIEICGLCTDICVITNALALRTMFPNNVIKVDASCCAGSTPEKHKAALEVMKSCLIDIINE